MAYTNPYASHQPFKPVASNALHASVSKPQSGIYAGSGAMTGGTQGRAAPMHMGVGGTVKAGGITPGSSPKINAWAAPINKPAAPAVGATPGGPAPIGTPPVAPPATGGFLKVYKIGADGRYHVTEKSRAAMTPAELAKALASPLNIARAGATSPAAQAGQAAQNPLNFKDGDYWMQFDQANRDYRAQVDPLSAELAALQDTTRYGGKTLYDFMFDQAQNDWQDQVRASRDQQAKSGLLRSGAGQRQLTDLGSALQQQQVGLSDQYGAGRLGTLATQLANYQSQFNDPGTGSLASIAKAAQQRAIEKEQERIKAAYGMTIDPSKFTFKTE